MTNSPTVAITPASRMPVTSAAAVVAASVTMVPSPSAPAPIAAAAATALRAPSARAAASRCRSKLSTTRCASRPTDSMQPRPLDVEGRHLGIADDAIAVLPAALGQVQRDLLPLPQVGADHPVDQVRHAALDLHRRIGDDLSLEPLLHPRLVQQVEHPADAQHLVEVDVPALLHLQQDVLDLRHPQLELPIHVLAVHRVLPLDVVEQLDVLLRAARAAPGSRRDTGRPSAAPTPSGLASFSRRRSRSSSRSCM